MEFITRDYICSKEMFEQARAYQKQLADWGKHYDEYVSDIHQKAAEYDKVRPEPSRYDASRMEWRRNRPYPLERDALSKLARHHNIVYSVMRGRVYSQVENIVREHNEPSIWVIRDLLKKYDIDEQAFLEAAKDAKFKS